MTTELGGRPSKGERKFLATRAPLALATEAQARADELGLSVNDYLSLLLAHDLGLPEFAPKPKDPTRLELPIPAA
ncbi:hypothetical protein [Agromyces sp. GXQ0307]|uniref:hypothetical protein n=1 Tax=Agromyces sp. GXQ0307 TaxID=3377835 RepID=UPI00383BAB48